MGKSTKLMKDYVDATNNILLAFCEKHDFDYDDAKESWVGGDVGSIACCSDFYVDLQTMIDDLTMDAVEDEFIKWYDYSMTIRTLGISPKMNYRSWLRGAPRISDEHIENVQQAHNRVKEAQKELEEYIENISY